MLERVSVRNPQGQTIMLTLKETSEGILVKSVDGLDPVKTTISSTTLAQLAGTQYQSDRRESRNIIFNLGLDSRYGGGSVTAIRRRIDQFFMPGMMVYMQFYTSNGLTVKLNGMVESNEVPIFSKDPSATISVVCFEPDFVDIYERLVGAEARQSRSWNDFPYEGTVPAGMRFEFTINASAPSSGFLLEHFESGGATYRKLQFSADLEPLDRVVISTVPGNKLASRIRGGVSTSILYAVSVDSTWHQLIPFVNNRFSATIGNETTYYEMTANDRYGSI